MRYSPSQLYLYKKALGFNDKDDGLRCLMHDGQITRLEAIKRLNDEGDIPEEVIYQAVGDLSFNVEKFKPTVEKLEQGNNPDLNLVSS